MLGMGGYGEGQNDVTNTYGRKKGVDPLNSRIREEMEDLCNLYVVHSSSAPRLG